MYIQKAKGMKEEKKSKGNGQSQTEHLDEKKEKGNSKRGKWLKDRTKLDSTATSVILLLIFL